MQMQMYLQMQIDVYKGHTNGNTNGNGTANYLLKLKTMCATVQIRRLTFLKDETTNAQYFLYLEYRKCTDK